MTRSRSIRERIWIAVATACAVLITGRMIVGGVLLLVRCVGK